MTTPSGRAGAAVAAVWATTVWSTRARDTTDPKLLTARRIWSPLLGVMWVATSSAARRLGLPELTEVMTPPLLYGITLFLSLAGIFIFFGAIFVRLIMLEVVGDLMIVFFLVLLAAARIIYTDEGGFGSGIVLVALILTFSRLSVVSAAIREHHRIRSAMMRHEVRTH